MDDAFMVLQKSLLEAITTAAHKGFYGGTHRLIEPEATVTRIYPLAKAMGITRVANVTGLDWLGIPVVMVCRPNSRSLAVSQGKGLTLEAAKASGLMESIELFHAEQIKLPLMLGSYEELSQHHVLVDGNTLPLVKGGTFQTHLPLLWVQGYDLLTDCPMWVPFDAVSTDATCPQFPASQALLSTSNGLASGNHLAEAISHGISEIVERDAMTLWYLYSEVKRQGTRIDLATIHDPRCQELLDRFNAAGIETMVWDITSDVGVPVFMCLITENAGRLRTRYSAQGMGCHPCREIALLRAMTEAAQSRLTLISGSRDDMFRNEYEWDHLQTTDLDTYRSFTPPSGQLRSFQSVPSFESDSFQEDIRWQLERLATIGIQQVGVIDLTQEPYGIPVARVVIPGLEGPSKVSSRRLGQRAQAVISQTLST
jgi:YcaO-like protein with predicted kinase domain